MTHPFHLRGLIAAPHTPFTAGGDLNPAAIAAQCELLVESGVHGAFVCGTTGEGSSLSVAERKVVVEGWVRAANGRLAVVVHVGHNSLPEAVGLAAHAVAVGADAISTVAPGYFKPASVDALVAYCRPIAAAAPALPFYYYDIPSFTGVALSAAEFLERAASAIPSLAGVKYSNADLATLQECLAARDGRFDVVFGTDEWLLAALALGVAGAVGSTYNFAAPLYRRMISAFEDGDWETARREQRTSVALVRALAKFGFLPASKAMMGMLGVNCGPVRLPLTPLTAEQQVGVFEALKGFNVFPRPLQRPS